ncbi:MAG TPA: alpha/beta hydrolase [Lapillicoccus sp.]|nr:alpha/beta hydrolase [Lapillicoccus sp.]
MPVPLVLLPGMNCGPGLWEGVLPALGAGRDVLVPGLDRPSIEGQVEALLDRLPPRFALGGLSLGAIVAMAAHRLAAERVAGLFLVATSARPPTDVQHTAWSAQLDRLHAGHSPREIQLDLLPVLVGADADPTLRERTLRLADDVVPDELASQLRLQQSRTDERPGLRDVTVPCTVVAPGADQLCPLDRHTEIHSLATGSELVVIPSAPHLVTLTHPGPVATALTDWLRLVDG